MNGNGPQNSIVPAGQGFMRPELAPAASGIVPGMPMPSFALTAEQRLGLQEYFIQQMGRTAAPEDSNADFALMPPDIYHRQAAGQLEAVIRLQGDFTVLRADYNIIANNQYLRDGFALVNAVGRNDQDQIEGTTPDPTDGYFTIQAPAAPNLVSGFIIEWSEQLQITAPFTLELDTFNWKGQGYQPLDRKFALRIGGGDRIGSANGGMFGVLFAQRLSAQETCGWPYSGGSTTTLASGGMFKAVHQPAVVPPVVQQPTYDDADPPVQDGTVRIFIPGLTIPQVLNSPYVRIKVPTSLAGGFSCSARYITAASPQMADVRLATLCG
jgi:hypothetical protein